MPFWLSLAISIAVKFGVPFLLSKIPGLPAEVQKVIEELVDQLTKHKEDKKEIVRQSKTKLKQACQGVACPSDLVK